MNPLFPGPRIEIVSDLAAAEREVEGYLHQLTSQYSGTPEAHFPFSLEKAQTIPAFVHWLNSLSLVPGSLKKTADLGALNAIYVPFWAVNALTYTTYWGERREDYTDTESYTDAGGQLQTRQVTRTNWVPVHGEVRQHFDNLVLCASPSVPESHAKILIPRDGRNLQLSPPDAAPHVTVQDSHLDPRTAFNRARTLMETALTHRIKNEIGGKEQRVTRLETRHVGVTLKQFLVPAFEGTYRYNGKAYKVLINGVTGEVTGDYPLSAGKVLLVILLFLGIFAALAAGMYFLFFAH